MNYVIEYQKKIEAGEIVTSTRVRKIYKKLVHDIEHQNQYVFDEKKGTKPIEFIERFCKHSKGRWAGKPVKLELFQKAYIQALFGFVDKETGLRKYNESLFMVARKNGKSTMLAGIALYMLIADNEAGAEVYSASTKLAQSKIIFNECLNMVNQSPDLRKHLKKRKTDLYFKATMSKFEPLGAKYNTMDGLNGHCIVIDELHECDRGLYEVLKQSQSARQQPLLLMITTAGTKRESIFDDLYKYACDIVDGIIHDERFLPIIYELDSKEEWKNPNAWTKANPALGTIKKLSDIREKVERAKQNPKDLNGILCKDFDIRSTTSSAWLTFDTLNNEDTFNIDDFAGVYAIGGADLSRTTDLTCATLLMIDKNTMQRHVTQMYWLPADRFEERVKEEKIPYDKWRERGLLRLCEGNTINYSDVTAWFVEMVKVHGLQIAWIGFDSWSSTYWREEMEGNGFNMVRVIQGAKTLSLPMQHLGADLEAKKINYNNNPILKWCMTNVQCVEDRNGNIVPTKANGAKQRIDGFASLLDAYVVLHERYNEYINAL